MARRWAILAGPWVVAAAAVLLAAEPLSAQTVGEGVAAVSERESRPLGAPGRGGRDVVVSSRAAGDVVGSAGAGRSILDNSLVRTSGSLAIVLGLIYGLARLAKRMNVGGGGMGGLFAGATCPSPAGVIEVLGRYPIGRGQMLVLLRLDTRVLLLGQSMPGFRLRGGGGAGGLVTLCEVDDPEQVASVLLKVQDTEQAANTARFGELLGRFDARHEDAGVVEVGRKGRTNRAGDRAELWDAGGGAVSGVGTLRGRLAAMRAGGKR